MKKEIIISFEIFGFYIRFTTNDNQIYILINKLYSNLIYDNAAMWKNGLKHRDITIMRTQDAIYVNNSTYDFFIDECEIIDFIIDVVNDSFDLFEKNKYAFFHGSTVSYGNKCILFIAPTLQGKTTLCTQMVQNGFTYLSDDLIIIDRRCNIYPFPVPIKLRKNKNIDTLGFSNNFIKFDNKDNIILTYKAKKDTQTIYIPSNIFLLSRDENSNNLIAEKSTPISSLNMLIRNAAYIDNIENHLYISKKLSESINIINMTYNNYNQIVDYIKQSEKVGTLK